MTDLRIITPETKAELAAVRGLCWDYLRFLKDLSPFDAAIIDLFYPHEKYSALMDRLPQEHAPPDGFIRLALQGDLPVGCGMVHRLPNGAAEIKRVYVTDAARGTGAGRAILQSLIQGCRDLGFDRILMDTSKPLKAAQSLYLSLGFRARGPYQEVPEIARDHLLFFEMDLT